MKLKLIAAALVLTAAAACKQKPQNDESNTADTNTTQTKENLASKTQAALTDIDKKPGVYFINLQDGDAIKSPVIVEMGIHGMEVEPAGVKNEGKGHHHIIIDGEGTQTGRPVAKNATHIHYGAGQTSDTLDLTPGTHTLTLQFADGLHQSYGPEWSKTVTVVVEK